MKLNAIIRVLPSIDVELNIANSYFSAARRAVLIKFYESSYSTVYRADTASYSSTRHRVYYARTWLCHTKILTEELSEVYGLVYMTLIRV